MNTVTMDRDIRLAKQIEAGLLAQEILDGAPTPVAATEEELHALVEQGRRAKDDLILSHLGLVRVIAAEAVRARRGSFPDLVQEGCVALNHAVMSYDWRKGPFGPYAGMWVRAAVRRIGPRGWVSLDKVDVEDKVGSAAYDRSVVREGLAQVLSLIPSAQRDVLRLRNGWDGRPRTRKDVAGELGLTVSKVRHLERVGLEAVRQHWEVVEAA
ncbi:MAG: sigma-70 family RNA polymerase sigma factor [Propionibacteriaceae bacterium]|nr:sigma-70 family RNA polymerase sigma factor [Propionibacteriaceae bacterium]